MRKDVVKRCLRHEIVLINIYGQAAGSHWTLSE